MPKQLTEAQGRKPTEYEGLTFFSHYDAWHYHFVSDNRLCNTCELYAQLALYAGNDIRVRFPFLVIEDPDLIQVNVHPNCRCYLKRMVNINDPRYTQ